MSVKIRLQRHGKKGKPFFHIVVADSRAKRDGRFIEKLGIYNPVTNPATIDVDINKAVEWLQNGAQPTDTVRAILSYKGAIYKNHLMGGVRKGAFDEAEAEKRFSEWLQEKEGKVMDKKSKLSQSKDDVRNAALEAEAAKNQARIDARQKIQDDAQAAQKSEDDAKAAAAAEAEAAAQPEVTATDDSKAETAPVAETATSSESDAPTASTEENA